MTDNGINYIAHSAELHALYEDLHRHPELGLHEVRTSGVVAESLRALGMEVHTGIAVTGVVGVLRGAKPGKTVLLRADMDALPVQEKTGLPYASETPGMMHACGHDGHVAVLLTTAKILAAMRDRLQGTVLFVFEPNEENAGAQLMIDTGIFAPYSIDACLALHLWTPLPTGTIGLASGGVMAGMEQFTVRIQGAGGHTGAPHLSRDPILAAADLIQSVQAIQTRSIDPLSRTVIMFGRVSAGSACNAIPDTAELEGTIRFLYRNNPHDQERPLERFTHVVNAVCALHHVEAEIEFFTSNSTVYNDPGLVAQLRPGLEAITGKDKLVEHRSLAGEDFSQFGALAPQLFLFVGAGNPEKHTEFPHHHPQFALDTDALDMALRVQVLSALTLLTSAQQPCKKGVVA